MIYWPLTQNGQYTCKTGYKFLKNEYDEASQDMYNPQDSSFWKGVWSLWVPNKVKNLMWRACKNSIPTKLNLLRRAIIIDPKVRQNHHCMLYGFVMSWTRFGHRLQNGIFKAPGSLQTIKNYYHGFWPTTWTWNSLLWQLSPSGTKEIK